MFIYLSSVYSSYICNYMNFFFGWILSGTKGNGGLGAYHGMDLWEHVGPGGHFGSVKGKQGGNSVGFPFCWMGMRGSWGSGEGLHTVFGAGLCGVLVSVSVGSP